MPCLRMTLFCLSLAMPSAALAQDVVEDNPGNAIIVSGVLPEGDGLVVEARPRCTARDGDPLDTVPVTHGVGELRVIGPDERGVIRWHQDDQPILGPTIWQRTGNAIGDYRFRVPLEAEKPICVGATASATNGYAGLRRIVSAEGMHGRYVHFSARVSTRAAGLVRFYLAAGDEQHRRGRGGDTSASPIGGTGGWRTVHLVVGPVPKYANHISYGFLLQGRGDAWLADSKLEVLTQEQALAVTSLQLSPLGNIRRP